MAKGFLVLAALVAAVASSCASGSVSQAEADGPESFALPEQVVGLRVQQEDVSGELETVERPYVDGLAVFSLRDEDLLRATLQVTHFNRLARPDDGDFRADVLSTIGGREPVELYVEGKTVTVTGASDQDLYAWFEGDGMFVLGIARDFEFPRTLLRRILELDPSI